MSKPLIGITVDNLDNAAASGRYELGTGYSRAVADAGGVPVLLPHELTVVPDYAQRCDGFILTGGVDPDTTALPRDWPGHAPVHTRARLMDPTRQAFEFALLDEIETKRPDTPLLGVCLGMQLLALRHGGTLNQFMPDTHPPEVTEAHQNDFHRVDVMHQDGVLAADDGLVKSNHQQAIATPGRLRVVAKGQGEIIEAVDDPQRRFLLGVQWHPERGDDGPLSRGLIAKLVEAV